MADYTGQKYSAAVEDLKNKKVSEKLIKIEEVESEDYDPGVVISQTPAAGATYDLSSNAQITLRVAKETSTVEMPNFGSLQYTYANARSYLIEMGIPSSNIERVIDRSVASSQADLVTSQTPAAGQSVSLKSTKITLYVTDGTTASSSTSSSESSSSSHSQSDDDAQSSSTSSSSSSSSR